MFFGPSIPCGALPCVYIYCFHRGLSPHPHEELASPLRCDWLVVCEPLWCFQLGMLCRMLSHSWRAVGWFWKTIRCGFSKVDLCHRNMFIVVVARTRESSLWIRALSSCYLRGFFRPLVTRECVCESIALAQPARNSFQNASRHVYTSLRELLCVRVLQAFLAWGISLKGETRSTSIYILCFKLEKHCGFYTFPSC